METRKKIETLPLEKSYNIIFLRVSFYYGYACDSVCVCACTEARWTFGAPGDGITGNHELPNFVGASTSLSEQ